MVLAAARDFSCRWRREKRVNTKSLIVSLMTLKHFQALPPGQQLAAVYEGGQFVATRWQAEHEAVNLYELPGRFFAELTYDTVRNEVLDVLGFDRHEPDRLADYAVSVGLPTWMPGSA